ncbi:zinc-dependent metalloprotease [Eilatimonas milleporae]|uniref:Uncharacterized protein DUF5117 n=1 Tax=Eilatimonas milleporae TaxID=911205 RepID=A0A3M0CX48_9PROT|nr:zinc-dependent metalloprotease [Eilatimonas milleporae]RMB12026.1 uncharacterized protein DUF5117 [Eilatimonas milleporae]
MKTAVRTFVLLAMIAGGAVHAQEEQGDEKRFADLTAGLELRAGLVDLYADTEKAKILAALPAPDEDGIAGRYLLAEYLTGGLGSNPLGLDRSVPSGTRLIHLKAVGKRLMVEVENTDFRASSGRASEERAVETSFARSIIWSGEILAREDGTGRLLVDMTGFFMRDAIGVTARLKARGQGSFSLDPGRSYVDLGQTHSFPLNVEVDAHLTFKGTEPGEEVRTTTPVPEAVTLIAHTTLMKLPEPGYEPRLYDPRAALIGTTHIDMSAPLDGDTVVRMARRFRLQKDADGQVIRPIVFYVDSGAPEPIRSALVEGASWWAAAFEAAGFPGGYRVEVLPEDAHPLDARYNVVNWVHRATRGWSYGAAVHDPRTGEALRGVVLLGSLRVRQDIKIFEALLGAGKTGTGAADDPVEIALDRIRQLAAHEVGHALGFAHNMAASTYGGRASVMDYPAPDIRLDAGGVPDVSRAYAVGMGVWDMWTVNFLYGDYGGRDDRTAQDALVAEAARQGYLYVGDTDSRSVGTGHWRGALWDTGEDAVTSLRRTLSLRRYALDRFGARNLRPGEPVAALQTKLVPLYLYHRYQLQAAAKWLGGLDFVYRLSGDGAPDARILPWTDQERALTALLDALSPEVLDVTDPVLAALAPLERGDDDPQFQREVFAARTAPQFDLARAAEVAANLTLEAILAPARASRLSEQGRLDGHPGLAGVLQRVSARLAAQPRREGERAAWLRGIVLGRYVEHLIALREAGGHAMPVRAEADAALADLLRMLERRRDDVAAALTRRIEDAFARARTPAVVPPGRPPVPPGSPIGAGGARDPLQQMRETCWHCDAAMAGM